jgi:hypothetical protein
MRSGVATKVAGSAAASALAIKIGLACVIATAGITGAVHYTRSSSPRAHTNAPVAMPRVTAAAVAPHVASPTVTPSVAPAGIELSREVALIDSASASLAQGTPLAALTTMKQYAAEARGTGQLAEEAAAIEVEATCAAKLPDAGAKIAHFDVLYPHSSQRARLTTACK